MYVKMVIGFDLVWTACLALLGPFLQCCPGILAYGVLTISQTLLSLYRAFRQQGSLSRMQLNATFFIVVTARTAAPQTEGSLLFLRRGRKWKAWPILPLFPSWTPRSLTALTTKCHSATCEPAGQTVARSQESTHAREGYRRFPTIPPPAVSAVSALTFRPLLTLLLAMRSSSDIPTLGPCSGKNLLRA